LARPECCRCLRSLPLIKLTIKLKGAPPPKATKNGPWRIGSKLRTICSWSAYCDHRQCGESNKSTRKSYRVGNVFHEHLHYDSDEELVQLRRVFIAFHAAEHIARLGSQIDLTGSTTLDRRIQGYELIALPFRICLQRRSLRSNTSRDA
jgi:hypothetical protein